jgi:hypothetical protein
VLDILSLDSLFAEMATGLGLALIAGNGLAVWRNRRGRTPAGVEGSFRAGRVAFLMMVGLLMTVWGLASLLNGA